MTERVPNREEILRVLETHAPRAMHVGELCGRLDVPRRNKDEVLRQLLLKSKMNKEDQNTATFALRKSVRNC